MTHDCDSLLAWSRVLRDCSLVSNSFRESGKAALRVLHTIVFVQMQLRGSDLLACTFCGRFSRCYNTCRSIVLLFCCFSWRCSNEQECTRILAKVTDLLKLCFENSELFRDHIAGWTTCRAGESNKPMTLYLDILGLLDSRIPSHYPIPFLISCLICFCWFRVKIK